MKFRLQRNFAAINIALAIALLARPVFSAENDTTSPAPASTQEKPGPITSEEFERLKAQLAIQQQQIEQLRLALENQQKLLTRAAGVETVEKQSGFSLPSNKLGEVASTTPVIPSAIPAPIRNATLAQGTDAPSPLSLKIGESYLTPVGFMDLTYIARTTNVGSGLGTNFGGIPYSNTVQGKLSDGYLTANNSRIGARFDSVFHGTKVLGYWESDFLGNQSTNALVSSNSVTFRLRLFYIDLVKDHWEILGGQSWSMMTPNRKGISPLPSDIFYSQDIDTNYQVGLPWQRVPSFRLIWHPTDKIAWGFAAENAQQYLGGSTGGGTTTLPATYGAVVTGSNVFNTGANNFAVPTMTPDFVSKLAFDPKFGAHQMHFEVGGILRTFRDYNPANTTHYTNVGGGGSFNMNLELLSGGKFRLVENFFAGRGVGRTLFAQGPDAVINPNGAIGLITGGGTTDGFESQITKNLLIYGYYGASYFGRRVVEDTNGKLVGYGYTGSPNSQNRDIQEGTFGFANNFWKDAKYGGLAFYFQYSYLFRQPWYVAPGAPSQAKTNMFFVDLRYTLPGSPPNLK